MITNFETTNVLNAQIMGLSTDTKPTTGVQPNSLFWELDTNGMYFFDGTQWQPIGGSGGGGGSGESDFSTAQVTIVNNASKPFILYGVNIFDDNMYPILDSEDIDENPSTYLLYKGKGKINPAYESNITLNGTGNVTIGHNAATITGNCTITIADGNE